MAYNQMGKPVTRRQEFELIRAQLDSERSSFISHWRDLSEFIRPRRQRFTITDVNRGDRRNQKIIDSTATFAAKTLSSGMMSGITSPARPWFRLTMPDPDLTEFGPVKDWLYKTTQIMNTTFLKSNIYNILPITYGDLGTFGTACMSLEPDFRRVLRSQSFPIGSYMIAKDFTGKVNTFFREFRMTCRQLVHQFGTMSTDSEGLETNKINWDTFSTAVKSAWEGGLYEQWFDVCHIIKPNNDYDPRKIDSKYKKFLSCYYERGYTGGSQNNYIGYYSELDRDKLLSEKGYDYFPILAPRWETTGEDVYGTDCPGMTALGDIKQLQLGERRSAQAIELLVKPPTSAPTTLRNQKSVLIPGDVTYVDVRDGQQGVRTLYEINPRIQELEAKQQQVRTRIDRAFYVDLFLMLSQSDRRQITAREIDERHEEKLLALGPVLEQLNQDVLDPAIDITFNILVERGQIPPPPQEIAGQDLKVEYISIMAQAQKLIGLGSIERLAGFVGQVASVTGNPTVLDKLDSDQLIDVYGDMSSAPPGVIRTDEAVAEIRQGRAAAEQQAAQQQQMMASAQTAKDLSQAKLGEDNALDRMVQAAGGQ